MSERFTVEVDITAKDQTSKALNTTRKGFNDAFKEIATGALRIAGEGLAGLAQQIPAMVVDLGKLGMQSQVATQRFERFAGGADQAATYLEAFNVGTMGTVDRMTAMASSAKLLQMGLVSSGDQMQQVAAMATRLGDQTMDAGSRISDFAALLANQSIPRLDNFGISSGRVRQRIDELLKSGRALDREEAFKMAVMEEGAKALETLGDTSTTMSARTDTLKAAFQDIKVAAGELIVNLAGSAEGIEKLAAGMQKASATMRETAEAERKQIEVQKEAKAEWDAVYTQATRAEKAELRAVRSAEERAAVLAKVSERIKQTAMDERDLSSEIYASERSMDLAGSVAINYGKSVSSISYLSEEAAAAVDKHSLSQGEILHTILETTKALESQTETVDDFVTGMDAVSQLRLSMSWTTQLDQMAESAADFAKKREEIETEHQSKIEELRKRGAATAIRIDVEAEQEKLAAMRRDLEIALQSQSEQTAKTALSSQMRKEDQIASIQEQIAAQEKMLDDYNAGRLVRAGENVTQLIALENQRKDAAIASLDEQMAKEQQLQEQALGRMTLEAFDQWAEQKDIPVERMLEMRTSIAEEFGLVSEGATELVDDMVGEWDRWAQDTGIATDDVVNYMGAVITETGKVDQALLNLTAQEWVIKVRYETSGLPPKQPDDEPTTGAYQHGGSFFVGENGVEMVTVQPLNTTTTLNETVNIYGAHAGAAYEERRRRERALILGRTM